MSLAFIKDRAFMSEMLKIAVPIALQQFFNACLNLIDVVMVGQLGEASIAGVGLSNQVFFVFILLLFGLTSGMAIFSAQFWGKQEIQPIRGVLGMSISTATIVAFMFTIAATMFPRAVIGLFTKDGNVIEIGSQYLGIVGFSYIAVAVATSYIAILRSIQFIMLTVIATISALLVKTAVGYILIFGHFGFPALGVRGAAIGTVSGWTLELILILVLVYTQKTPLAANPLTFFTFDLSFFKRVLKTALPATANELIWSVGIATYYGIYARISTEAVAAVNVNATIEELAFVIFIGMGNACAVMVGNRIGAGRKDEAYETVRRVVTMSVFSALLIGLIVFLMREAVVSWYNLSPTGAHNVRMLMLVMACVFWVRMFNFSIFIGALRAGGDTLFALVMELCSIWLIGVPSAYIGAFVLGLPVYLVYLMIGLEELVKAFVSLWRFRSRRWIHDLVNVTLDETSASLATP